MSIIQKKKRNMTDVKFHGSRQRKKRKANIYQVSISLIVIFFCNAWNPRHLGYFVWFGCHTSFTCAHVNALLKFRMNELARMWLRYVGFHEKKNTHTASHHSLSPFTLTSVWLLWCLVWSLFNTYTKNTHLNEIAFCLIYIHWAHISFNGIG